MIIEFGRHLKAKRFPALCLGQPSLPRYASHALGITVDLHELYLTLPSVSVNRWNATCNVAMHVEICIHLFRESNTCIYTTILQAYGVEGTDVSKVGNTTATPQ